MDKGIYKVHCCLGRSARLLSSEHKCTRALSEPSWLIIGVIARVGDGDS